MTRLLLIRHGNSQANTQGFFAGQMDSALTELGLRQAEKTAEFIVTHYSVDAVYASDLQRAFATGEAVARKVGLKVIPSKGMREIFAGSWEGCCFDVLKELPSYEIWKNDIGNAVCDAGESVADLQKRVVEQVLQIAKENAGKTVVIATHATPIRALQCFCEGKSLAQMKDVPWVSNASVTQCVYDGEKLELVEIGQDAHLEGIKTQLPPNC